MELFNIKDNNSERTFELAIEKAKQLNTGILIASTSGNTALAFMEKVREENFQGKVVVVTHAYGSKVKGTNAMSEEIRERLKNEGATLVTAAHALSGAERSLSNTFKGAYPVEIIAHTLRMISAGTKVCVEIGAMALDAGEIPYNKPVVAIGGTGRNADTACVITPSYSSSILESRINEFLCKPDFYNREEN